MILPLPYPGYSWSITQHTGPGTDVTVLYGLLKAAQDYGGESEYQIKITDGLVKKGILTPNVRKDQGREQAWRDYQQILSELGLIVSTRFTNSVVLTPIGLLLLDGLIGFSELLATQCFNYQYPNGHKQALSTAQKKLLRDAGMAVPATRTELDTSFGVLIKPAVLILRVLAEGVLRSEFNTISAAECLHALVPIKQNADWPLGYDALKSLKGGTVPRSDTRRLRHVQEWFRLIGVTDIFDVNDNVLSFTPLAHANLSALIDYADLHADPGQYWIPPTLERSEMGVSWFKYYGNPAMTKQWMQAESEIDQDYIELNYPDGIVQDDAADIEKMGWTSGLNLTKVDYERYFNADARFSRPTIDPERIEKGHRKRQEKTLLHDKIVGLLAKRYVNNGYSVFEDRNSVDLLAVKDDRHSILEVKTVTPRSLTNRIRSGVGQLCEYRYRREVEARVRPTSALVLSNKAAFPQWMIDYFSDDLGIELLSLSESENFYSYTDGDNSRVLVGV